jgi:hypothetical protein
VGLISYSFLVVACSLPPGDSGAYRDGGSEAEEDHGGTHVESDWRVCEIDAWIFELRG